MSTLLIFLLVIIVLVVAHELGHFFVAKLFKVKVEEFGVGYPPRATKLFTWRETIFTLNWLPFGGFVKIVGEEGGETDDTRSFAYQKMWKRLCIIAAGVVANVLLAMILYAISFSIGFMGSPQDFPNAIAMTPERVTIVDVQKGSPAAGAGFLADDSILALSSGVDHNTPTSLTDVVNFVQTHGNKIVDVSIMRKNTIRTIMVTPVAGVVGTAPGIGISLASASLLRLPLLYAISFGARYTLTEFGTIIVTLGSLARSAFGGNGALWSDISGPVGIAQYAGVAFGLGAGAFLSFVALISVNLAVVNLLPFPALDGGRFILELFTSKGRSRISQKAVAITNQVGFVLLIILMLYVTYHDIARIFT